MSTYAAPSVPLSVEASAPWRDRLFPNNEWVLLLVLLFECVLFGITGHNFLTRENGFEIIRLSVEIGLLALAMTPIIITGGIDLSVGSMMGLCAVECAARSAERRRARPYPSVRLFLLYFCWKRSTRPAVSRNLCFPV